MTIDLPPPPPFPQLHPPPVCSLSSRFCLFSGLVESLFFFLDLVVKKIFPPVPGVF